MKLARKRKWFQTLTFPAAVGGFVWLLFRKLDIAVVVSASSASVAFLIPFFVAVKSIRKPAAWIDNGVLKIRGGFSSTTSIPLADVEAMRYEAGGKVNTSRGEILRDALYVKLRDFEEWEIPVTDYFDHIEDDRLYNFINENFYELPREVLAN